MEEKVIYKYRDDSIKTFLLEVWDNNEIHIVLGYTRKDEELVSCGTSWQVMDEDTIREARGIVININPWEAIQYDFSDYKNRDYDYIELHIKVGEQDEH